MARVSHLHAWKETKAGAAGCPGLPPPLLNLLDHKYLPLAKKGKPTAKFEGERGSGGVPGSMRRVGALQATSTGKSTLSRPLRQRRQSKWLTRAIGIDLGTTNSAVAVTKEGKTFVVPGPDETKVTRSVVSYNEDGGTTVGQSAREMSLIANASTFSSVKRLMGRRLCELDSRMYELLPYFITNDFEHMLSYNTDK